LCAFQNLDASLFEAASALGLKAVVAGYLWRTISSEFLNQHSSNLTPLLVFDLAMLAYHSDTTLADSAQQALISTL